MQGMQVLPCIDDALDGSKENVETATAAPRLVPLGPAHAAGLPVDHHSSSCSPAAAKRFPTKLRALTPSLLDDVDDMGLSPMMMQRPLFDEDRRPSVGRPLQPQMSGAKSPSRRGVRSVHVTPPIATGSVLGISQQSQSGGAAQLDSSALDTAVVSTMPAVWGGFSPGLTASTPALRMIEECLRDSRRAVPWTPRAPAVEPQNHSVGRFYFEFVMRLMDAAATMLVICTFVGQLTGKLAWWTFCAVVPDKQRWKVAICAVAGVALLLASRCDAFSSVLSSADHDSSSHCMR
jgi:hypothetical protein